MFWLIYIFTSILLSHIFASIQRKKYAIFFVITLIFFLTPAQVDLSEGYISPAVFSFVFNALLEKDYSLRVLRPLLLTVPLGTFLLLIGYLIKRKFFSLSN
jgi:hypothetical protein